MTVEVVGHAMGEPTDAAAEESGSRWTQYQVVEDDPVDPGSVLLGTLIQYEDGVLGRVVAADPVEWELVEDPEDLGPSLEELLGYTVDDGNHQTDVPLERPGQWVDFLPHAWGWQDCDDTYEIFDPDPYCLTEIRDGYSCAPAVVPPGYQCIPSVNDPRYFDLDDDREPVDVDNDREKAVVQIRRLFSTGWSTVCTGVILTERYVLTAAHCVFNENNDAIPPEHLQVLRRDLLLNNSNGRIGVAQRFVAPGFTSFLVDPKDDYALLRLDQDLVPPFADMDISDANLTTMQSMQNGGVFNLAYPYYGNDCEFEPRPAAGSGASGWYHAELMVNSSESLGAIYDKKFNLKMDGLKGHSGSPIYYCPGGGNGHACAGAEEGQVIGVWSGWNGFETTSVAARATGPDGFRAWALAIINN